MFSSFFQLLRVDELVAMLRVKKMFSKNKALIPQNRPDMQFCYSVLNDVSRSFAPVIIQLDDELRDATCIFYLVLRALDTIEDDMSIPLELKLRELPVFHEKLFGKDWSIDGIGKGRERELLEKYPAVIHEFQCLKPEYQDVISDICKRMADGMCHFLQNEVVTKKDYNLYCHYVAGLVGHGLTRLFVASGLEDASIEDDLDISNEMGLFLQKVNIIRDYYEDILEEPPRMFWPKEIWGLFAPTGALADFKEPSNKTEALECLNAMIADATQHIPNVMRYLAPLKSPSIFIFCAIPQVMAIATLNEIYNNHKVFSSKVKIGKGEACRIILNSGNLETSLEMFGGYMEKLQKKLSDTDPSYDVTKKNLELGFQAKDGYLAKTAVTKMRASYTRSLLTSVPMLGGQYLVSIVESVTGAMKTPQAE